MPDDDAVGVQEQAEPQPLFMKNVDEAFELGLLELVTDDEAFALVEWPQNIGELLDPAARALDITLSEPGAPKTLSVRGAPPALSAALAPWTLSPGAEPKST